MAEKDLSNKSETRRAYYQNVIGKLVGGIFSFDWPPYTWFGRVIACQNKVIMTCPLLYKQSTRLFTIWAQSWL